MNNQFIQGVTFDWDRIDNDSYLKRIEAFGGVKKLDFNKPVTFFVGENGSGKSTLLEALAVAHGFNPEGGTKNYVSYGYRKCDDDKHKIEIDTYAANVVKDIFRMKLQGMSQDAIACKLNENGILCPADYKKSEGSNYQTSFKIKDKSGWSSTTVRRILTNEIYIGNLVQGKHTTPNHKVKKMYVKDESEWVRIEKNHEAIVSERDFELVQRLLVMDTRTAPGNNEVYNLSGLVICADCGVPMVRKNSISGGRHYSYYMCATNKYSKNCSSHRISVNELDNAVLELLKVHISNILEIDKIIELIGIIPFQQIDMKKLEERKKVLEFEVERCTELRSMLYSDMKEGVISKSDYIELHAAYENKRKDAQIAIHKIELEMESILEKNNDSFKWLEYFKENRNIKELTRSVAVSLIREIKVYDKKNIEVTFDFDNPYKTCLKNIENMGYKIDVDLSGKLNIEKEAV